MRKPKGTRPAIRQRTGQLSVPQQILEGLRQMAEFATSGEPPEKRYTVRQLTLDLEPGDYTPDKVRATREVFGLSQPLFAKFLGVEVSALRHWEQGVRAPSAVVRRFLDEMNAPPTAGGEGSRRRFGDPRREPSERGRDLTGWKWLAANSRAKNVASGSPRPSVLSLTLMPILH